jgi:AcrR family transcriptional regulator
MATGHTTLRLTGPARREQILDTAEAIVEDHGFHAVSIDRVARESGITRPVVYTHFGDLDGLLNAVVDRANERTLEALARIVPTEPEERTPAAFLEGALRRFLDTVRADPATWRLALLPPESAPRLLGERIARDRATVIERLATIAGPWLGDSVDADLVGHAFVAIAEEAARMVLADPEGGQAERILGHVHRLLAAFTP